MRNEAIAIDNIIATDGMQSSQPSKPGPLTVYEGYYYQAKRTDVAMEGMTKAALAWGGRWQVAEAETGGVMGKRQFTDSYADSRITDRH
jgi:hypothetical protein